MPGRDVGRPGELCRDPPARWSRPPYIERDALTVLALVTPALPSVRQIDDAVAALRVRYPVRPGSSGLLGVPEALDRLEPLLRTHIRRYGTTPDMQIFQAARGGIIQDSAYIAAWAEARQKVLIPASTDCRSADAPTTCATLRCRYG
jgi:hypothetical protein